ncbi:putative lateral flagellar export/assembly protein LafU [Pragia fontium]|uniref:Chemotaxis protein MotB n=1 Tax=Pragia fontium DSM 5563 = ATCC 49100 TaxID=1122977 RepID=A0AAJ4W7M7_9GAMM|nr:putative lateral flagellar export/assembly protein LafU [Pragia fontium]SFC00544.1 chemotaxis protein MotB [Pragia fontium DSM 5563 = ATCC 49100]SUB81659.1 Chemotaxis protein MotB [Pragia fontium]VEJ54155.1 Chemotaxis protein MotB [Pragia fontium]
MKRAGKSGHTTIIKRSSKRGHHALHTGAWKVAFADFTLAMMALFMVLWIVNSVSQEEREEIVSMLNRHSIFDGNPFSPISSFDGLPAKPMPVRAPVSSGTIPLEKTSNIAPHRSIQPPLPQIPNPRVSLAAALNNSKMEMEELARVILKITEALDAGSNLNIEIVPQGLRILIQDDNSREMFQRGSAHLSPFFNDLLMQLGPVFNEIDNPMIITGHTDAVPYKSRENYNNWNLSGDRALEARRVLEKSGLDESKVLQVNAMSSQMLLDKNDPDGAQNRRIEIMVLTKSAADALYQFFGDHGEKVVKPAADKLTQNAAG